MANVQYYDVILKPVVTEKTMELMGDKKYTFFVHPEATKSQFKEAVEKMFDRNKSRESKHNELRRKEEEFVEHTNMEKLLKQKKQS